MSDTQRHASSSQNPSASQQGQGAPSTVTPPYRPPVGRGRQRTAWAGWVVFAGIMMIIIGGFQAIAGLAALFRDAYYLVTSSGLLVSVDYTAWGWVHLILSLILVAAGFAVMRGAVWGRVIGVILAALSALVNLAFLAAYPLWSALVIAMDIIVIFALTVHGSEVRAEH